MCTIDVIDIDIAITVLRVTAAVLAGTALLCLARAGWGMLSAGLATVLALLVFEVNSGWVNRLDTGVELWIRPHRSPMPGAAAAELFGFIGVPAHFAAAVIFCGTLLALRARSVLPAGLLVAAVGAGVAVEHILKAAVERNAASVMPLQGPPLPGTPALYYLHSFPSGHVTGTAAFLGMVAVCLGVGRSAAVRARLAAMATAAVLLVGLLAVYCRAHTASDVLGGIVLGGVVVAVGAAVLTAANAGTRPARAMVTANRAIASRAADLANAQTAALPTRRARVSAG